MLLWMTLLAGIVVLQGCSTIRASRRAAHRIRSLGTGALYSGDLPLSRIILFCNVFTVFKNAMLAPNQAEQKIAKLKQTVLR